MFSLFFVPLPSCPFIHAFCSDIITVQPGSTDCSVFFVLFVALKGAVNTVVVTTDGLFAPRLVVILTFRLLAPPLTLKHTLCPSWNIASFYRKQSSTWPSFNRIVKCQIFTFGGNPTILTLCDCPLFSRTSKPR